MIQQTARSTQHTRISAFVHLSDEDLALLAQQGDRQAFLELVDRNYHRCFRLALGIMRNRHDAEDQVQSAFLRALEHLDQFRYRAKFSSWLSQIVINQCRMRFREMQRTRNFEPTEEGERSEMMQLRSTTPCPEQDFLERDLWATVKTEMRMLPTVYREVLVLRYLDQLSLTDMADRLGVTVATVKSRLFRGQIELRRRMVADPGRRPAAMRREARAC